MYWRKARTRELRTTAYHGVPQRSRKRSQKWTQALLARDELDGWPGLRP